MENFINNMFEFVNYLGEVNDSNNVNGGTLRDIDISIEWLTREVERFGGTVVLDCRDYGGDHAVLFSFERHYPDTISENRYCVVHITQDGYLVALEQGTFDDCFACLVEWSRTEVMDVA